MSEPTRVSPVELEVLGGPGSGHFGHAGRPGKVGGSSPFSGQVFDSDEIEKARREILTEIERRKQNPAEQLAQVKMLAQTLGEADVYHGTVYDAWKSIKEKGLVPRGSAGADTYAAENLPSFKFGIAAAAIPERNASVYLTSNLLDASNFASLVKELRGAKPVVLKVKIPASALPKLRMDELSPALRFAGRIPPEWIKFVGDEEKLRAATTDGGITVYAVFFVEEDNLKNLGGRGSGYFGHAGRPGKRGGSSSSKSISFTTEDIAAERAHQEQLAAAQKNPLAHPPFVLGADNDVRNEFPRYVAAYGEEFTSHTLPEELETYRGKMGECFKNASLAVVSNPHLTYAEGFAVKPGLPWPVVHAWGVDKEGRVYDFTWKDSVNTKYFGVKYDRDKYLKYLYKAKFYGVLGSTFENAQHALRTGVPELRPTPVLKGLGGPGSGFWGHAGRPGKVGGSASGSSVLGMSHVAKEFTEADAAHAAEKKFIEEGIGRLRNPLELDRLTAIRKAEDDDAREALFNELKKGDVRDEMKFEFLESTDDALGQSGFGFFQEDTIEVGKRLAEIDHSRIPLPTLQISVQPLADRVLGEARPGGDIRFKDYSVSIDTVIHEIGHQYEFESLPLRKAARLLQDTRRSFPNPYTKVRYATGDTEVISTGLVEFMRNPAQFRRRDPEHFKLILDMMEGKYAPR